MLRYGRWVMQGASVSNACNTIRRPQTKERPHASLQSDNTSSICFKHHSVFNPQVWKQHTSPGIIKVLGGLLARGPGRGSLTGFKVAFANLRTII